MKIILWVLNFIVLLLTLFGSSGCMMDANKIAGWSNPSFEAEINPRTGKVKIKNGQDASGGFKGEVHFNPDTKQFDLVLEANVSSTASTVVEKEGGRITKEFIELQQINKENAQETRAAIIDTFMAISSTIGQIMALQANNQPAKVDNNVQSIPAWAGPMQEIQRQLNELRPLLEAVRKSQSPN